MVLVAGIAASVILQTMNSLEEQALSTGRETTRDISSGLRVTQVTGYKMALVSICLQFLLELPLAPWMSILIIRLFLFLILLHKSY